MNQFRALTVMIVGGGSGGHLTPLLAIAKSLKARDSHIRVVIVGQKKENLNVVVDDPAIDRSYEISAGKFRRYHGEGVLAHLRDVRTILLNIRDMFRTCAGIFQSLHLLGRTKPDVILLKGGFVSVPVGLAARIRRVPYITHDSDAVPGLANRITSSHAAYNTTAMAPELYPYDQSKTVQVGVPLRRDFCLVGPQEQATYKKELGIRPHDRVLLCTGGGLGAQKLNRAMSQLARELLEDFRDLQIVHLSGKKLFDETRDLYHNTLSEELYNRVRVLDFIVDLHSLSGAADVIVTRAGATSLAEFAAQAKACVVVPNPVLTGGQQIHNADVLRKREAAFVVDEDSVRALKDAVSSLLKSSQLRQEMGSRLHGTMSAYGDAADRLTDILLAVAEGRSVTTHSFMNTQSGE